ncbi:MAG: SGNH/GDSL hydrolase family protein [Verrucomicrobiales bacterium]|jgi:lysophospholipase L1-like esterase|nr:SGNH/GDSL hydrolase family protein [Verrucomicrobiales bacterium]
MMMLFPTRSLAVYLRAFTFCLLITSPLATRAAEKVTDTTIWRDVSEWGVEGQGWLPADLHSRYDRLPAKAEKIVRPPVWSLSRDSAGIAFRFNTDATTIQIRYTVGDKAIALPHMPATGVSGVDLYALDKGTWKWVDVTRPKEPATTYTIAGLDPGKRTYMGYLPLYNSTVKIEIGIPEGTAFEPIAPRTAKPVVFYGTSITHGASASRPGLCHPAILGRRLDRPVINLGFSGNGKMEPEVVALLSEIDAAVYVIDCLPNMTGAEVAERAEPLVRQLRKARPDTPIVLVEDRSFTNSWIFKARRDRHAENRASLIRAFDLLVSSGVKNLHYIEGENLLGDDTEGATDGSHPNDLGFMRQADIFEPVLRKALGQN